MATERGVPRISPELVWNISPFLRAGYCTAARNYLRGLHRLGFPVKLDDMGIIKLIPSAEDMGWYSTMLQRKPADFPVCIIHSVPGFGNRINILKDLKFRNPGMGWYVNYTTFETDRIPYWWVDILQEVDEIWVPSTFNLQAFSRSGIDKKKINVIPHAIDTDLYNPYRHYPAKLDAEGEFKFLSIFEWKVIKGWDVLLKAYFAEFRREENTLLTIHTNRSAATNPERIVDFAKDIETLAREHFHATLDKLPRIFLHEEKLEEKDLPAFYLAHDAFILPTRGEGWGLPMSEAMAMEIPTAATNWSGHLEFMHEDNSYLIQVDKLATPDPNQLLDLSLYAGHMWAEPSIQATQKVMREMFECRSEAKRKAKIARQTIVENFSLTPVCKKIISRVQQIAETQKISWLPAADTAASVPQQKPRESKKIRLAFKPGTSQQIGQQKIDSLILETLSSVENVSLVSESENPELIMTRRFEDSPATQWPWIWYYPQDDLENLSRAHIHKIINTVKEIWISDQSQIAYYTKFDIPPEKLRVVPFAIDTNLYQLQGEKFALATKKKIRILSVSSLNIDSGIIELFFRYFDLFRAGDDVTWILKTHPSMNNATRERFDELLQNAKKLSASPEVIVIENAITEAQMAALYRTCDLYFAPARKYQNGQALLEAMACGLPVIAPRHAGLDQLLHESRAFPYFIEEQKSELGDLVQDHGNMRFLTRYGPRDRDISALLNYLPDNKSLTKFITQHAHSYISQNHSVQNYKLVVTEALHQVNNKQQASKEKIVLLNAQAFPSEKESMGKLIYLKRILTKYPTQKLMLISGSAGLSEQTIENMEQILLTDPSLWAVIHETNQCLAALFQPFPLELQEQRGEIFHSEAILWELIRLGQEQNKKFRHIKEQNQNYSGSQIYSQEKSAVEYLSAAKQNHSHGETGRLELLEKCLTQKPDYIAALAEKIEALMHLGKYVESASLCLSLCHSAPAWSKPYHLIGQIIGLMNDHVKSLPWLYLADQIQQCDLAIPLDLAHNYEKLGLTSNSIRAYLLAWRLNPNALEILGYLLDLILQIEDPELQKNALQELGLDSSDNQALTICQQLHKSLKPPKPTVKV